MGQLYSHILFRPPSVVTYQSNRGELQYVLPDEDGLPHIHSTPLIWLVNKMHYRIPCAMVHPPNPSKYVAIYAHQNGEDLGTAILDAHRLAYGLNIRVMAFEYSGYGLSERPRVPYPSRVVFANGVNPSMKDSDRRRAEPSEKACCSDIIAVYSYLTDQCGVLPSNILLFGRSIGSGPAVYCASTRKVGGLVLISPIASAVRVPLRKLNVTLPFIDTFPNIDRAADIRCPVLLIHGDRDEIVPKLHGELLLYKLQQTGHAVSPLWIPGAMHNNVVEDYEHIVFDRYRRFLEELKLYTAETPISTAPRRSFRDMSRPSEQPAFKACFAPRESFENMSTSAEMGDEHPERRVRSWRAFSPLSCIANNELPCANSGAATPRKSFSPRLEATEFDIALGSSLSRCDAFQVTNASLRLFRKSMEQVNRPWLIG